MHIEITPIAPTRDQLKRYVQFGTDLYRDNPYFVPPLIMDDINTLTPSKNPAFDHCNAQSWLAMRDGKPVGRITAIINNLVNERTGRKEMRFGFVDFINDDEVVDALFETAKTWGREHGMTEIVGPMGFTDMDHEGMLTSGYDQPGTMATIYNYPYYPEQMRRMGYQEDAHWVEYRINVPPEIPEKMKRIAAIVAGKYGLKTVKFKNARHLKERYGVALFELINKAYDKLYGYSPLTKRQIKYYIDLYLPILRLKNICVIVDGEDNLVGVGISMPSMSDALRKSSGRLFPTGWYHLLKAMYGRNEVVDLLLVAVDPAYQNKGVNSLLFTNLIPAFNSLSYRYAESNPELADNTAVQSQWDYFECRQHRNRATFRAEI